MKLPGIDSFLGLVGVWLAGAGCDKERDVSLSAAEATALGFVSSTCNTTQLLNNKIQYNTIIIIKSINLNRRYLTSVRLMVINCTYSDLYVKAILSVVFYNA